MPDGFIVLTTSSTPQSGEVDIKVEDVVSFVVNSQDPNGGSIVTLESGAQFFVSETVEEISQKIKEEKESEK